MAIPIVNWCLLVFGAISALSAIVARITYRSDKYLIHDLSSWTLYFAIVIFLVAVFCRFILLCVTGG